MIYPLSEGTYTVDVSKTFIPFDSSKNELSSRPASLIVDIVPFLVETKRNLIVIDPGLGFESSAGDFMIYENIRRFGFSADEVTMVLLSHLHKDHTGGICYGKNQSFNLMFPKANYYCQEKEMEYSFSKKDSPSFDFEKLDFLRHSSRLNFLNGNGNLNNEVAYTITGGHTPFHQAFDFELGKEKYFYGGDVLPQSSQMIRRFVAKYDFDGKKCATLREEWTEKAVKENQVLMFFHDSKISMAKVKKEKDHYTILKK